MLTEVGNGIFRRTMTALESLCIKLRFKEPQPISGCQMLISFESIPPDIASVILSEHHIHNNRNEKRAKISGMVDDLTHHRWVPVHQGVAFNEACVLCDGQHRLRSAIEAGVSLDTLVVFNVPTAAMVHIDGIAPRSINDSAKISGESYKTRHGAIIRVLCFGETFGHQPSKERMFHAIRGAQPVLDFIDEAIPSHITGITTSPVLGAIARAWYHEDRSRLREFMECLKTSVVSSPEDSAVAILCRYLMANAGASTGHTGHRETYLKTQKAIESFCRRQPLEKLYAPKEELYPLPLQEARRLFVE